MESEENEKTFGAHVDCAVVDKKYELNKALEYMKFICKVPKSSVAEIVKHIEKDNNGIYRSVVSLLVKAHSRHPTKIIKDQHTTIW
jgi:hypothetical protein